MKGMDVCNTQRVDHVRMFVQCTLTTAQHMRTLGVASHLLGRHGKRGSLSAKRTSRLTPLPDMRALSADIMSAECAASIACTAASLPRAAYFFWLYARLMALLSASRGTPSTAYGSSPPAGMGKHA